jgi:hypothetical protein
VSAWGSVKKQQKRKRGRGEKKLVASTFTFLLLPNSEGEVFESFFRFLKNFRWRNLEVSWLHKTRPSGLTLRPLETPIRTMVLNMFFCLALTTLTRLAPGA